MIQLAFFLALVLCAYGQAAAGESWSALAACAINTTLNCANSDAQMKQILAACEQGVDPGVAQAAANNLASCIAKATGSQTCEIPQSLKNMMTTKPTATTANKSGKGLKLSAQVENMIKCSMGALECFNQCTVTKDNGNKLIEEFMTCQQAMSKSTDPSVQEAIKVYECVRDKLMPSRSNKAAATGTAKKTTG